MQDCIADNSLQHSASSYQLDNILEGLIFDLLLQLQVHICSILQWADLKGCLKSKSCILTEVYSSTEHHQCSMLQNKHMHFNKKKKNALKDSSAFTLKRIVCIFMVQQEQDHCSIFRSHSPPVQPYSVINTAVLHKNLLAFSY